MAFVISDRIKESSTTTGTGTLTLAGAVTGFTTFAAVGNANTCTYAIIGVDANGVPTGEWETGIGTYTSSGTTLSRGVIKSSNANALVTFSAGTKHVICTDVAGYATPLAMTTTANRAIQVADQTAISSTAGNVRGKGAVDLQIKRGGATQVASGTYSVISGGSSNYATAAFASVGGGNYCSASGNYSRTCGGRSILNSGSHSCVGGGANQTCSGNYAVIAGGKTNHAYSAYSFVGGGKSNEAKTSTYATVVGGKTNIATGQYSFIGGGASNTASGNRSAITGGHSNTASAQSSAVIGGISCTASALYSVILGGSTQTASGTYSVVSGGKNNTASGSKSITLGGSYNTASAVHSTAAGYRAKADKYGQLAKASGPISTTGDAQASQFVLRKQTTNNTQAEMFLDNSAAQMSLANDTTWAFEILIVARRTDANDESAAWQFSGCIDRNASAAATAIVGAVTKTVLALDTAGWDVDVTADTTGGALRIRVTGSTSKTINWVAFVRTVETTG